MFKASPNFLQVTGEVNLVMTKYSKMDLVLLIQADNKALDQTLQLKYKPTVSFNFNTTAECKNLSRSNQNINCKHA